MVQWVKDLALLALIPVAAELPLIIGVDQKKKKEKSLQTIHAGEGVKKRDSLTLLVSENVNWYSHYGEQNGVSLKN